MEINRNNYEQYLIDYIDGTLSDKESRLLLEFLDKNPELKEEMERIGTYRLEPDSTEFPGKDSLKQSLFKLMRQKGLTFQEFCAASVEGDLEPREQELLMQFVGEDAIRVHDLELMKKAVLRPGTGIVFEEKKSLKKPIPLYARRSFHAMAVVAAAVVLFMLVFRQQDGSIPAGSPATAGKVASGAREKIEIQRLASRTSEGIRVANPNIQPATRSVTQVAGPERLPETGLIALISARPAVRISTNTIPSGTKLMGAPGPGGKKQEAYLRPEEYLAGLIRKSLDEGTAPGKDQSVLLNLADAGFRKLEELTDEDFQFKRKFDEQGNLRRLTLETPLFGISAPLRHNNAPK